MQAVTIIGAGVAGLTVAHQLARQGFRTTVVEKNAVVGGLARTFHYGDFHFDVGPHRFHTENRRVEAFIRSILGSEALEIPRKSGARMFGRFHEWPLRPSVFWSMPLRLMLRGARDLIVKERLPGESFESDIVNKYGRTLHEIFFEPYTRKFLFHSPSELHRDWARAGVNRAVIDQRVQSDSLWSLLKNTLMPRPVGTTFLYPPHGVGRFSDLLAQRIVEMGGDIRLGQDVAHLEGTPTRIDAVVVGDERIVSDHVIWTAPLTTLNELMGIEGIDLQYLSTIFYNLEIGVPPRLAYQWTYFGGEEVFSRVTAPEAFLPTTTPKGRSGLCVELTCREGDERWREPERYTSQIIDQLVRTGVLASSTEVERVHIERVPFTYPIYKLNYLAELTRNLKMLAARSNLVLAGRCGRFSYNNMDHSIGQGLTVADKLIRGERISAVDSDDRDFWETASSDAAAPVTEPERQAESV